MAREQLEIERKFDVEEAFVLPDLSGVPGVSSAGEPVEHTLEAIYHDTADLRLARAKVTLRRRTGGTDAGWHVKLPAAAGARRELHSPLGRARKTVPTAVLAPALGIVRHAPVTQVAGLRTRRLVTELYGEDGRVLAEVADDHVTGTAFPAEPGEAAVVSSWREVEVELVDGDEQVLSAVGEALVAAGAQPSPSASKLIRVLGNRLPAVDPAAGRPAAAVAPEPHEAADGSGGEGRRSGKGGKKARRRHAAARAAAPSTAADLVRAALADLVAGLQDADLMVRTDTPDGIHQVRVSCRRLRSVLAAFRPVLDRERTDPLRAELQWAGGELSGSRDAEVALGHLRELVAAQPPELVLGPVAARLQQEELRDGLASGDEARTLLGTRRYLDLLDALADLVADPPFTERAAQPAAPVVRAVLARTVTRLTNAVDLADGAVDPEALHGVRKAAKRLRYTADVAVPVLGDPARDLVDGLKDVQEVLGRRQDTFVTRELCTRLGAQSFAAGGNPWTFGRLHGLEQSRGEQAAREFWTQWPRLRPVLRAATR
ncbi:CYTH and CHAD domain-containing protein [Modestobacter lapidis]|nr:CYTH and CHAD domain-containing protein [Modestobacter lapidis]